MDFARSIRQPAPTAAPRRSRAHFGTARAARFVFVFVLVSLLSWAGAALSYDGIWSQVPSGGTPPPARRDVGAVYDSNRDRLLALGSDGFLYAMPFGQVWAKLTSVPLYASTGYERAVYDEVNDVMIVVNSNLEVWSQNLSSPGAWVRLDSGGQRPPLRTFFAVAYDSKRHRLYLFGGGPYTGLFNDLWWFPTTGNAGTWTQTVPGGTAPPGLWGPLMIYDSLRDRLVLGFGSSDGAYTTTNDLWAVGLAGAPSWASLPETGTPPTPMMVGQAIYDPADDALLLFGGYNAPATQAVEYQFAGDAGWHALAPLGGAPNARFSGNMFYRPAPPQMLLFGGFTGNTSLSDVWTLTRAGVPHVPVIATVTPVGGRVGQHVTIEGTDLDGVNVVTFGGVPAPLHSVSWGTLVTEVPVGAATGPLVVGGPSGSATWTSPFFVGETPVVTSVEPDSGRTGDVITLRGHHFTGATLVQFGGTGAAAVSVISDSVLFATVDTAASSGLVLVVTPAATGASDVSFSYFEDNPIPLLRHVQDVRGDQGGKVQLSWEASDFDRAGLRRITGYRVWRRGQPPHLGLAGASLPSGWRARPARAAGPAVAPVEYWESLATLPAAALSGYAYTAATTRDSVAGDPAWTAYFVEALTAEATLSYASVVDSGYSVDNLAPPTPSPFAVVYAPGGNTLHWRGRTLADLRGYEIHRGASATFVPSAVTKIALVADTTWQDLAGPHFYKLAAVDVHGNRSYFASASPQSPVATLAAFVKAERAPGRVELSWYAGGNPGLEAIVYRRTLTTGWERVGVAAADGEGWLRFTDAEATDTERYGYRLGVAEPEGEELALGEAWIDALQLRFALLGIAPNPSRDGRVSVSFSLPASERVRVQLFDVAGREVASVERAGSSASVSRVEFGAGGRLATGVYLLRATSGGVSLARRVVVLN